MASVFVPCAHCNCHAKSTEATCPSCGEPLRRNDGSVPRSAVAVLLGLTAASALAGSCGNGMVVYYGPAPTTSSSGSSSGTGGTGGAGGASGSGTSGVVFYGPSPTTTSTGGTGGTGGTASSNSSSSSSGADGGDGDGG